MRTDLALVRPSRPSDPRSKRAAVGAGLAIVVAIPALLATVPLMSLLCVGAFVGACAALAAVPWPRREAELAPEDIADPRLRATYAAVLIARGELETAIAGAPAYATVAESLRQRCRDAVRLCARIAPVANRLQAYLAQQDVWALARQAADLRAHAQTTTDTTTARTLVQAAAAYERHVASCEELGRTRDRIHARLELVLASLRAFAATVVKQQTVEDEQIALAGETVAEHVDGVREELAVLECALALDAAA